MKTVFWGTPEIAVPSLKYFIEKNDIEVLAVITQPDKPAGRGHKVVPSPVKILALENNIPIFQPRLVRKDEIVIKALRDFQPDAFITVAFGQILSKELLDIPRLGTINLHASLLPKYRGPNPIQWALINGESKTGITTMLSDVGVDTGAMLIKKEINIPENMNTIELCRIISETGPSMLYDSLTGLNNNTIIPVPQNDEDATYAPKLNKEDGKIDWSQSALVIHNKIRGMLPWPSTYTGFKEMQIKILESELKHKESINNPQIGEIIGIINNGIEVVTGQGNIIIKKLQIPGKKAMEAASWYNGARIQKQDRFI